MTASSGYEGENVINGSENQIAGAIRTAVGTSGSARTYLEGVKAELDRLGIDDPAVTRVWVLVNPVAA